MIDLAGVHENTPKKYRRKHHRPPAMIAGQCPSPKLLSPRSKSRRVRCHCRYAIIGDDDSSRVRRELCLDCRVLPGPLRWGAASGALPRSFGPAVAWPFGGDRSTSGSETGVAGARGSHRAAANVRAATNKRRCGSHHVRGPGLCRRVVVPIILLDSGPPGSSPIPACAVPSVHPWRQRLLYFSAVLRHNQQMWRGTRRRASSKLWRVMKKIKRRY